jgi:hypothetical protein
VWYFPRSGHTLVQLEGCWPERGTWSSGLNFYTQETQTCDSLASLVDRGHSDIPVFLDTACTHSCSETDVMNIATRKDAPNPTEPFEVQVEPAKFL